MTRAAPNDKLNVETKDLSVEQKDERHFHG